MKTRALNPKFITDLKSGCHSGITNEVHNDDSLMMCLRGDYVTVYYKSMRILEISENGKYNIDRHYGAPDPNKVADWNEYFKNVKKAIDSYNTNEKLEKEIQQMIARENTCCSISNATDYFIFDVEYTQADKSLADGRFDALAVHWPRDKRRNDKDLQIAFIEIKVGEKAILGSSGLIKHYNSAANFIEKLKQDTEYKKSFLDDAAQVVAQLREDDRRLFYSGDFRSHDHKGKLFNAIVKNPPQDIDVQLMEGSCLGRKKSEHYETEASLENKFLDVFKATQGVCLIQTSSQNVDRIVTIYRACKKSGRQLVMSGYTGHILMCLENPRLPNFTWPDVKKFAADDAAPHKITKEIIAQDPSKYTILLGGQIFKSLESNELLNDKASFIYSMWDGYKELYQKRLELMQANNLRMEDIHTSGHADIPTLKKFAKAINPKRIVPVHTFFPEQFQDLFENVERYDDNETFEI